MVEKRCKNIIPNGGEIHGDEPHGFESVKNHQTKQIQETYPILVSTG